MKYMHAHEGAKSNKKQGISHSFLWYKHKVCRSRRLRLFDFTLFFFSICILSQICLFTYRSQLKKMLMMYFRDVSCIQLYTDNKN